MFGMGAILTLLPIYPDITATQGGRFTTPQREQIWFEYLAVSPSYELARRFRSHELNADEVATLPPDFGRVLSVFDNLGDVQRISFWDWWTTRGAQHFSVPDKPKSTVNLGMLRANAPSKGQIGQAFVDYTRGPWVEQGLHDTLIIGLPIGLSMSQIMSEVRKAVETAQEAQEPRAKSEPTYKVAGRRIHDTTLVRYLYVLYYRSVLLDADDWRIGAHTKISSMHSSYVDPVSEPVADGNAGRRKTLGILTNRVLKHAWLIAENAARGVFPSHHHVDGAPKFNYAELGSRMIARDNWRVDAECRDLRISRKEYTGRQLEKLVKLMPRAQPNIP